MINFVIFVTIFCYLTNAVDPPYTAPCKHKIAQPCYGPVIGSNFMVPMDHDTVMSLLPDGLEYIPQKNFPAGEHPIIFFFNEQHHVGVPFLDQNYLEFILMIPFVQWDDTHAPDYKYRGPFGYGAKLYLNSTSPTLEGQAFGINKELADIQQRCTDTECTYTIVGLKQGPGVPDGGPFAGKTILEASWSTKGSYKNASDVPNFEAFDAAGYRYPTIGKYPVNNGDFKCTPTNWYMDIAWIQPVVGKFKVNLSFMDTDHDGHGKLKVASYDEPLSIMDDKSGAFRLMTMWNFETEAQDCKKFNPKSSSFSSQ